MVYRKSSPIHTVISLLVRIGEKIRKIRALINDPCRLPLIGVLLLSIVAFGCRSGRSIDGGVEWEAKQLSAPDLPFVEFQAQEVPDDSASVKLWIGVKSESLIYLRLGNNFEAVIEMELRAFAEGVATPALEKFWIEKIHASTYAETRSEGQSLFSRTVDLPPGDYRVELTVRDRATGKQITRRRFLSLAETDERTPYVSGIQLLQGRTIEGSRPVLGPYVVPSKGRIFGSFHVRPISQDEPVVSEISVMLVGWDSTSASPPYAFNPLHGSLEYTGLDIATLDTVETMRLESSTSTVSWELGPEQRGVYLIVARNLIPVPGGERVEIEAQRPFVVMNPGFPKPSVLEDLIGPLRYLLRDDELENISELYDPADRRNWLEQFWRERGENQQQSEDILERYYSRVEEANEYFSSFKPGWQTDRGMIYIIFGPPLTVRQSLNSVLWSYSHTEEDRFRTFEFRRIPLEGDLNMFDHFVLTRQPYYDTPWMGAVDSWRYGIGY